MKKVMFAILAIAAIAFTNCSKNEDNATSLIGTVWVETDGSRTSKLTFKSDIECELITTISGSASAVAMQYTYEYSHPTVMAYPKVNGYATMKGIISGNTMNVINASTEKTIATLTKQ